MKSARPFFCLVLLVSIVSVCHAQVAERVVDIPTRPGVVQRIVCLTPSQPRAAVILFAGSHGGLQISPQGIFIWGKGNFLVRSRQLFADQGLAVAVVDSPSDRQRPPYLTGFRQTPEHVADIRAVIAWLREQTKVPVWLVGTSRGTESAAFIATRLAGQEGPDGIVLTSTILADGGGRAVPDMDLGKLTIPVLVVHHEQDGCGLCQFRDMARLMDKLGTVPRKELLTFKGGLDYGNSCEAFAHHGFNGLEREAVGRIARWILSE
jgi:pimeloyl-ACP methyl ester carboxylesterase